MKLNNIHQRKDFLRLNELIGGREGGVGSSDGFASNVKMKDSVLGKLVNGIFRGIGWLWRKSKENFIINRLIAELINELMRGTILFCFDNNINIKDGSTETKAEGIKQNSEENKKEELAEIETEEPEEPKTGEETEEPIEVPKVEAPMTGDTKPTVTAEEKPEVKTGTTKPTLEQRIKMVKNKKEYNEILVEYNKKVEYDKKLIVRYKGKLQLYNGKLANKMGKKDRDAYTQEVRRIQDEVNRIKNYDIKLKQAILAKQQELGLVPKTIGFDTLKKDSVDTFQFNPTGEVPEDLKKQGVIPYDKIKVDDISKLKNMESQALEFLRKHINNYDKMNAEEKKRMLMIYMQYAIINAAISKVKESLDEDVLFFESLTEDLLTDDYYEYLYEENIFRTVGKKLGQTSGTAKVKPDESRAGKVGIGKSVAMKAGAEATVGDILTKRDKQKYKEKHEKDFGMNIHSVDLAGIENTIVSLQKNTQNDLKKIASTYVNPYNLKVIQLSADKLMLPRKTKEGVVTDEKLKIRWKKEVDHVYAGFTNIMNIDSVDITRDNYQSSLTNDRDVDKKASSQFQKINFAQQCNIVSDNFVLDREITTLSSLKGDWCLFHFSDEKTSYHTSIAPVNDFPGLIMITEAFVPDSIDSLNHKVARNTNFWNKYFITPASMSPTRVNVYFMMKSGQGFPKKTLEQTASMFVINECIVGDKRYLYIKMKNVQRNIPINDDLFKTFNKDGFLHKIGIASCSKFKAPEIDKWMPALRYSKDVGPKEPKFTDFQKGKRPYFLEDPKMMDNFKKLQKLLETK
jgi:hypothetical protein